MGSFFVFFGLRYFSIGCFLPVILFGAFALSILCVEIIATPKVSKVVMKKIKLGNVFHFFNLLLLLEYIEHMFYILLILSYKNNICY